MKPKTKKEFITYINMFKPKNVTISEDGLGVFNTIIDTKPRTTVCELHLGKTYDTKTHGTGYTGIVTIRIKHMTLLSWLFKVCDTDYSYITHDLVRVYLELPDE